nr:hypothetical protein [uncultured Sphingomonas sp.]
MGSDRKREPSSSPASAATALRTFRKEPARLEKLPELLRDESDRGAVILVGSFVEDLLADRIIAKLPHGAEHKDELLKIGGVLNSYQAKLIMGQALGVITKDTAEGLEIIRQMRNACAHSRQDINLRTPELLNVFRQLLQDDAAESIKDTSATMTRAVFNFVAIYYFELLVSGPTQAERTFETIWEGFKQHVYAEVEKRKASQQKRRKQSSSKSPHSGVEAEAPSPPPPASPE